MDTNSATTGTRRVEWQGHRGLPVDAREPFEVIDCEVCGFKHVTPLPTREELAEIYRHEYYDREKPLYLERAEEDEAWWRRLFGQRLDQMARFSMHARRRVLDVGTGPGLFLVEAQARGWEALGLEPSNAARAYAQSRGCHVLPDFLGEAGLDDLGTFSAVHLSEVLEHVPDPFTELRRIHGLLDADGVLCVSVPNDYNPVQELLALDGKDPWWVAPPHHLNYFDFDSLERLFERAGFRVLTRETTFPIDFFLLMGEDYVGNDALGRRCHAMRMRFESSFQRHGEQAKLARLYDSFAELGFGRHAIVYGRKED